MKRRNSILGIFNIFICLLAAVFLFLTANVKADSGEISIVLQSTFGLDGQSKLDIKWPSGFPDIDPDSDFITTYGVNGFVDYGLSRYLSLGADIRALWWNTESGDDSGADRNTWLDIGPSVRLGAELFEGGKFFIRFAPGLTIATESEDLEGQTTDTGLGFNISGFGGFTYRILDGFGVSFECGFIFRQVYGRADYRVTVGGEIREGKVDIVSDGFQVHLSLGVFFTL